MPNEVVWLLEVGVTLGWSQACRVLLGIIVSPVGDDVGISLAPSSSNKDQLGTFDARGVSDSSVAVVGKWVDAVDGVVDDAIKAPSK